LFVVSGTTTSSSPSSSSSSSSSSEEVSFLPRLPLRDVLVGATGGGAVFFPRDDVRRVFLLLSVFVEDVPRFLLPAVMCIFFSHK